jgi:serine/threonine protein kinase
MLKSGGGTPSTWAPEVAAGKDRYKSADWWSIGIVIYQMMYQKSPFDAVLTREKDETDELFIKR